MNFNRYKFLSFIINLRFSFFIILLGEGDAFGNLSLSSNSRIHISAVTLRSSCCVDIHVLDLKDLNEVLESFPQFKRDLRKKINSISRKTVLTSQVRVAIYVYKDSLNLI